MKKLLSLFVVAIMAMSMCVITASADGFYPVDGGTFSVIGDWDFEEATIAENLFIPDDGNGTVTYADGGVTFTETAGGKLPGIQFLPSKVTSAPAIADYVYYEFTMDLREVSQYNAFRFNLINSQATRKIAGYINLGPEYIGFYCVNKGGSGKEIGTVDYTVAADESKTKIGMLVNLSQKYYAAYINGEMVCEKTFSDQEMRTGYMTGDAEFASLAELSGDYAITIYDYKFYKGSDKSELPYTKIAARDLSTTTVSGGTEGTYTFSNTDGINLTMTADAEMPEITLPGLNLGKGDNDTYYYEFVVNSGNLSDTSGYVIALWSSDRTFFGIGVAKNTLTFARGNGADEKTYTIPADKIGKDIKIGLVIDQNDPDNTSNKGRTYVYIDREYFWKTGNNDRNTRHPFAQKIVVAAYAPQYDSTTKNDNRNLLDTTQTTGDQIVVKSLDIYHYAEGAEPVVIPAKPEEGAFSASAFYTANAGAVTANVTLTKAGNAGWYNKDTVIVASYAANGALIDFQKVDGKVKGGATETISLTVNAQAGGKVRAFLWDDMNTLVPTATFDVHNVD